MKKKNQADLHYISAKKEPLASVLLMNDMCYVTLQINVQRVDTLQSISK